ncbi:ABC transporter ATP-binding protein [Microbacterium sp. NC79]|uniref:ABC transporter ATP-binding protein n=1 Tax=Microbacterium sp. NC79 TaxID=2851009 RepID=UPI001C2B8355|nr:ABC transporter ATP-binding protein [Microbacterium sp. NC79]MBV0893694.1 ABC transporter ATP-binding protein [Microbacterium sp. NC79]
MTSPAIDTLQTTRGTTVVLRATDVRVDVVSGATPLPIVRGVDLELAAGEALGLVGESGSGKSVLSRNMMGLSSDDPTIRVTGSVLIENDEVVGTSNKAMRKRWGSQISIVLQDPLASLNPVRKVGVQVAETVRQHDQKISKAQARERAADLLRQVGIADPVRRLDVYPHEMSGGMRQRVMIAIALAGNPRVLIADEPTTALDVTVQAQILDLLDAQRDERSMGVILVTHDLSLVASRTDRVAVMYGGRIVEQAPTRTLFASPAMPYTRALLDAVPPMSGPTHVTLAAIPGAPPTPSADAVGCRFAARCALATDICREIEPDLLPVHDDPEHLARCHYPLAFIGGSE